jgi:hypothetical protein
MKVGDLIKVQVLPSVFATGLLIKVGDRSHDVLFLGETKLTRVFADEIVQ